MAGLPKIVFAGDRELAVRVLDFILARGCRPEALLVSGGKRATHAEPLMARCDFLPASRILAGASFKTAEGLAVLREVAPDYIVGVHFPYIVPDDVLAIPTRGFLNLHPAYLPYNRGWHTASWAILEGTPYGATLHLMAAELDAGAVLAQRQCLVEPHDTAHTLYQKALALEYEVFTAFWPRLVTGGYVPVPQDGSKATRHDRADLATRDIQEIDLNASYSAATLIDRLRAMTTSDLGEAASFVRDGKRYRIQVRIVPSEDGASGDMSLSRGGGGPV